MTESSRNQGTVTSGPPPPGGPPALPPDPAPTPIGSRQPRRWLPILVLLALLVLTVSGGIGLARTATQTVAGVAGPLTGGSAPLTGGAASATPDLAQIAAAVDPGLVDVDTTFGQGGRGAGTGIILDSSGLILTNNHVISGATHIAVTAVATGRTYEASVVGYDVTDDVAVLQAQGASGLTAPAFGASDQVSVGDSVVAIGNAGGVGGTPSVAAGKVTALDQDITVGDETGGSRQLSGLIQVAAKVQPGDSGGPLVNTGGQVIGVDTAASATTRRSSAGVGFAIPIDTALGIERQIVSGTASRTVHIGPTGALGVMVRDAPGGGVLVAGVSSGSPAGAAGLTAGATIQSLDGQAVDSISALTDVMAAHHPGDTVQVAWTSQSGQRHTASVQLTEGPPA